MPERTCDHYPSFQVSSYHHGAAIIRLNDIFTAQFCPRYLLILIKCCRILCYSGFIDWVDSIPWCQATSSLRKKQRSAIQPGLPHERSGSQIPFPDLDILNIHTLFEPSCHFFDPNIINTGHSLLHLPLLLSFRLERPILETVGSVPLVIRVVVFVEELNGLFQILWDSVSVGLMRHSRSCYLGTQRAPSSIDIHFLLHTF